MVTIIILASCLRHICQVKGRPLPKVVVTTVLVKPLGEHGLQRVSVQILKVLLRLGTFEKSSRPGFILAPPDADPNVVRQLRSQGEQVVNRLYDQPDAASRLGCDRELKNVDGHWQVVPAE